MIQFSSYLYNYLDTFGLDPFFYCLIDTSTPLITNARVFKTIFLEATLEGGNRLALIL